MASQYSDHHAQRAFTLRKSGVSMTDIAKREDMPSKKTLYEWANGGRTTDGIPWDTKIEAEEAAAILQVKADLAAKRADAGQTFLEEMADFIENDAAAAVMAKIKLGEFDASVQDLDRLVRTYSLLKNASTDKMEFAAWFMRRMFDICVQIMDARQFAEFRNKASLLQSEVQIKLNPMESSDAMKQLNK